MAASVNGTAQRWRERIVAQQVSGQSVRAWCRQHGCHEHGFYGWRARLGLSPRSRGRRSRRPEGLRFAEVVVGQTTTADPVVLRLRGGRELILPAAMPVEHVARLIHAIEGAA